MKKEVFILRHGETDLNKQRIVQGSGVDAPLNDTGYRQAARFYQKWQDFPFELVITVLIPGSTGSLRYSFESMALFMCFCSLARFRWLLLIAGPARIDPDLDSDGPLPYLR